MALRFRRGTDAERLTITPQAGEPIYTIDTKALFIGDGVTQGGLQVTGAFPESINDLNDVDIASIVPEVGQTLKWNGEEFIPGDFILDQEANVNIVADDSTVLVNTDTKNFQGDTFTGNTFTGNFVGDVVGSVFSDDSTLIVDGISGNIFGSLKGNVLGNDDTVLLDGSEKRLTISKIEPSFFNDSIEILTNNFNSSVLVNSDNTTVDPSVFSEINLRYSSVSNTISDVTHRIGRITFSKEDISGVKNRALITGYESGLSILVQNPNNDEYGNERITWFDGETGDVIIGGFDSQGYKLDVRGSGIFHGNLEAAAFKGSIVSDDSTTIVDGIDGTITATGFIQFGSYSNAEIDLITPANGMVYYNTTDNRFRGYQNGSWINLDNGSAV